MSVPIAHISGGDITEGAIDNQVRHAVSKLAHLHFPGTAESAARLIQMGEDPARVFAVGEPGLDNFRLVPHRPREEVAARLALDPASRWVLYAYHPETLLSADSNAARAEGALDLLARQSDVQVVMTYPNADPGGLRIAAVLDRYHRADPLRFHLVKSLGQDGFVDLLREAYAMVGNSSAGVVEAVTAGVPALNVGDRQTGRLLPPNVVSSDGSPASLAAAWAQIEAPGFTALLSGLTNPYGDGHTAERIKTRLASAPLDGLLRKGFHEKPIGGEMELDAGALRGLPAPPTVRPATGRAALELLLAHLRVVHGPSQFYCRTTFARASSAQPDLTRSFTQLAPI